MLKESRVLVTGATGFIGHNMVITLEKLGVQNLVCPTRKDFDLCIESDVERLLETYKPDVVFHLAGLVGGISPNKEFPADYFYQNLMMGTLLLHYSYKHHVKRFIAAGAGCGYPLNVDMPLREDTFWDGLPQPESAPYSLGKRLLTIQSEAYFRQYGFSSTVCIPGNVYGPWDNFHLENAHVIPALVRKFYEATLDSNPFVEVWGDGTASRDFVHVQDVVDGMILSCEKYDQAEVVNLSSGVETTIREVCDYLVAFFDYKGEIRWNTEKPSGQKARCFDMSKAAQDLNFVPQYSIEQGLESTVMWYKEHSKDPALRL